MFAPSRPGRLYPGCGNVNRVWHIVGYPERECFRANGPHAGGERLVAAPALQHITSAFRPRARALAGAGDGGKIVKRLCKVHGLGSGDAGRFAPHHLPALERDALFHADTALLKRAVDHVEHLGVDVAGKIHVQRHARAGGRDNARARFFHQKAIVCAALHDERARGVALEVGEVAHAARGALHVRGGCGPARGAVLRLEVKQNELAPVLHDGPAAAGVKRDEARELHAPKRVRGRAVGRERPQPHTVVEPDHQRGVCRHGPLAKGVGRTRRARLRRRGVERCHFKKLAIGRGGVYDDLARLWVKNCNLVVWERGKRRRRVRDVVRDRVPGGVRHRVRVYPRRFERGWRPRVRT